MQLVSEKPLLLAEAKALLDKRQKDGELSFEQQNTLTYLQEFTVLGEKEAHELKKDLVKQGLSEAQAIDVVNLMPAKEEDLRNALGEARSSFNLDQLKSLLKIVKDAKPKI